MKNQFSSLVEMAQELEKQAEKKVDLIVPSAKMSMDNDNFLAIEPNGSRIRREYRLNEIGHDQVATKLGIPRDYYQRIGVVPGLRSKNVNAWLEAEGKEGKSHLVRTMENTARAFLSDRYKPIDNDFIFSAAIPAIAETKLEVELKAGGVSERRMYLQVVFPHMADEVAKGDVVRAMLTLTNSEVGYGAYDVKAGYEVLRCLNGAVSYSLLRRAHLGRRVGEDEEDYDIYRDDTIKAEMESFRLRTRDVIKSFITMDSFQGVLNKLRGAASLPIKAVDVLVKNVTKKYGFGLEESAGILQNLMEGGQSNAWGLSNAVTALVHKSESMDRQYDLEKIGSQIIDLDAKQWEVLNN